MKDDLMVPIDKAGRVVLPKQVREELAIIPGDRLKVSIRGNEVTLRPARAKTGFIKRGRALVFSGDGGDLLDNDTVETIRANERGRLLITLGKGLASPARK